MRVKVHRLSWSAEAQRIIKSVNLRASSGELVGLVGPNGSGKSSLLRLIYRYLTPDAGFIYLDNQDISAMDSKEVARNLSVVMQERDDSHNFTVYEVVAMGRNPHKGLFDPDTKEDEDIILDAMKRVGILSLANRVFYTLSGGEKQRALIALALAQQTKVLVLDEPTNHLDLRYQFEVMELVRSLGITTIAAMHDLNHAATFCDRIYLLNKGRIVSEGTPISVLTDKRIKLVYGIEVMVEIHPLTKQLNIVFTGVKRSK